MNRTTVAIRMTEDQRVGMANIMVTLGELRDQITVDPNNSMNITTGELKAIIDEVTDLPIDWKL